MDGKETSEPVALARRRVDLAARVFHHHLMASEDSKEWRDKGDQLHQELEEALAEVDRLEEQGAGERGHRTTL